MIKYYLLILLAVLPLQSEELPTCYSVQLQTDLKLYNPSFRLPKQCQIMRINGYVVYRCGCYETRKEAQKSLKYHKKNYPNALLVKTYKYRFHKNTAKKSFLPNTHHRRWENLNLVLNKNITFNNSKTSLNNENTREIQSYDKLQKNQTSLQDNRKNISNFYGLSLQGKYEQYINQDYRFREYTDYDYDLKLQFDIFKDGFFQHKRENTIQKEQENITYIQNLSKILKNNYAQQLLLLDAITRRTNFNYYNQLASLYKVALKYRKQSYQHDLSTVNDIDTLKQMQNRFKKSAQIYKTHTNTEIPKYFYKFLQDIEHLKLKSTTEILSLAKKNNSDIMLEKARAKLITNSVPAYSDNLQLNLYAHRRVVDEMGWYNTLGIEGKIPLDFSSHEEQKVAKLQERSNAITQESFTKVIQNQLLQLIQNFSDIQQLIKIDRDDIIYLQRRVKRYERIEQNMIPNLNYNPQDKIVQFSYELINLKYKTALKKIELVKIIGNIAYLSNTPELSHIIKGF
jgi:hypothetical protein